MSTVEIITAAGCGVFSLLFFVISMFQFNEKGFLLNNAWIYASKAAREKMDKRPYYRQSAIVFLMLGGIFLLNTVSIVLHIDWLSYVGIAVAVLAVIYAIVSSIQIEKKKKRR